MVLLSASTENYMRFVAELLEADALLCTPIDEDGKVRHNCHGKDKVVRAEAYAAQEMISFEESCAFGDSGSDIYILTRVGDKRGVVAKWATKAAADRKYSAGHAPRKVKERHFRKAADAHFSPFRQGKTGVFRVLVRFSLCHNIL